MDQYHGKVSNEDDHLLLHCDESISIQKDCNDECSPGFSGAPDTEEDLELQYIEILPDWMKADVLEVGIKNNAPECNACLTLEENINKGFEELEMKGVLPYFTKKQERASNKIFEFDFAEKYLSELTENNDARELSSGEPLSISEMPFEESLPNMMINAAYVAPSIIRTSFDEDMVDEDFDVCRMSRQMSYDELSEDEVVTCGITEDIVDKYIYGTKNKSKNEESTTIKQDAVGNSEIFTEGSSVASFKWKTLKGHTENVEIKTYQYDSLAHDLSDAIVIPDDDDDDDVKLIFKESLKGTNKSFSDNALCLPPSKTSALSSSLITSSIATMNFDREKICNIGTTKEQHSYDGECEDNIVTCGIDHDNIDEFDIASFEVIRQAKEKEEVQYTTRKNLNEVSELHFAPTEAESTMGQTSNSSNYCVRFDDSNGHGKPDCLISESLEAAGLDLRAFDMQVSDDSKTSAAVCADDIAAETRPVSDNNSEIFQCQISPGEPVMGHHKSKAGQFSNQFVAQPHGSIQSKAEESNKVVFVKPRPQTLNKPGPSGCEFIELLLATDDMFEKKPRKKKGHKSSKKVSSGINCSMTNVPEIKQRPVMNATVYGSHEQPFYWNHPSNLSMESPFSGQFASDDLDRLDDFDINPNLTNVNWIEFSGVSVGHLFVTGVDNSTSCAMSQQNLDVISFDDIIKLDELENAVIALPTTVESAVADGIISRFPTNCGIFLLVNKVHHQYPEYIIVCRSCSMMIIAYDSEATRSCPECRIVRLSTFSEQKLKCQFLLLRNKNFLRLVILSSAFPLKNSELQKKYGWLYDFPICQGQDALSETYKTKPPIWKDLVEFFRALQMDCLNFFQNVDFSHISPAVRLVYTKPGASCARNLSEGGAPKLKHLTRMINWKSSFPAQSLYKTERLDLTCNSALNTVFQRSLADEDAIAVQERVKVVYPSSRWVRRYCNIKGSTERLALMPTVDDSNMMNYLPIHLMHDLPETEDLVQNYNVLFEYEDREDTDGRSRKFGWFLTGSQTLDSDSWGEDYSAYHQVSYKHFTLSVGFFPYLHRNETSAEVEMNALDLNSICLPFDLSELVRYGHTDIPYMITSSKQEVFAHCVGVFQKVKMSFGFVHESKELIGLLDPFPKNPKTSYRSNIFLHTSHFSNSELPPDCSVVEFYCLNQYTKNAPDGVRVCSIFRSVEEARHQLFVMSEFDESLKYMKILRAKAEECGISWIDDKDEMEDRLEDYYQTNLGWSIEEAFNIPTNEELNSISMEPVSIPSDEVWLKDFYGKNRDGTALPLSPEEFSIAMELYQMRKYSFLKGFKELENLNKTLSEDIC